MTDLNLKLYLVTNRGQHSEASFLAQIEAALGGGVTCVQLREKETTSRDFYQLALKVKVLTDAHHVPLIINDHLDIALAIDAAGVHLGQSDLSVTIARRLMGPDKIIGISTKTLDQALSAEANGADYLGVGAIFPTTTKVITQPTSRETLKQIAETVEIPVVAIGGISEKNISQLIGTGIAGVAVVSAIMASENPKKSAEQLAQIKL